jgi:hypothetical protein
MLITLFFNILINIGQTFFQIVEPNIYRQDEDEAWRPPRSVLGRRRDNTRVRACRVVVGCGGTSQCWGCTGATRACKSVAVALGSCEHGATPERCRHGEP